MAKLNQTYVTADIPEPMEFGTVPPDDYKMMVTDSSEKATDGKNGAGKMVVLEIDIQDGEYAGRKIWKNFNIENPNPKAVDIAMRELGALARAVGVASLSDTEQVHNKMFIGTVTVEPARPYTDKDGNEKAGRESNNITKFMPLSGAAAVKPSATKEKPAKAAPAASEGAAATEKPKGDAPPWDKKNKGKKK